MITVKGKANISATILADSLSDDEDARLTTFEVEVPRIVWSELMTHRMLSRNAASSRAIPFDKMLTQLVGAPVRFGATNKGMQDTGEDHTTLLELGAGDLGSPEELWAEAKDSASYYASLYKEAGYHKQVYNRLVEPFSLIKGVISATEWNNFFWLRIDEAADPTIAELARCMQAAMADSTPEDISYGGWHLPYVDKGLLCNMCTEVYVVDGEAVPLDVAIKVSAARCAAVSYRNEDYTVKKSLEVYERLVGSEKKHSSALEHQATPMESSWWGGNLSELERGVTHVSRDGKLWSGNFQGWIQNRQLIDNHYKAG